MVFSTRCPLSSVLPYSAALYSMKRYISPDSTAPCPPDVLASYKSDQSTKLKEELAAPLRVMQEIARRIAKVSKESKLPVVEDDYVSSFKVELMDAVVQWCRGASFSEICKVCPSIHVIIVSGNLISVIAH